ncbi:MAG: hypothetical protein MR982_02510 [Bacteroides pyogenes]|uniref:hypothetical protein n=1 Tax=Bacteroides pyogenes TaxID=310300 RepID=UPI00242BFBDC|nr:hypothetical protein [Bacteroides pyogenes]MCI5854779.1 hypothetical protein [Prevotella sp.]MCI7069839.1 hypothetical protein [Bacteroides pyogenes]MDY5859071.1 hypothetical protein [Porphyromonas sp.]
MEKTEYQDQNFELRSEKVRSIVGKIPSALVRYGITAIALVLLILGGIVYYFPYTKRYEGTASFGKFEGPLLTDSIDVTASLRFNGTVWSGEKVQSITFSNENISIEATLLEVSSTRDSLEKHQAKVRILDSELILIQGQSVDFAITHKSGNIFSMIVGRKSTP